MIHFRSTFNLLIVLLISLMGSVVTVTPVHADIERASLFNTTLASTPPYSGTAFIDPDIITAADPTTFINIVYTGRGLRTMFDRRVNDWITVNAYLFDASYSVGSAIEIQLNPEFGSSNAASVEAQKYGRLVGQLPTVLRTDVKMLWIHKGNEDFGGGNNSILIHVDRSPEYGNFLEEILIHESAHTSLDADHAAAPQWLAAQTSDGIFISTYARDHPDTEDIAESFLPYLAVRYKSDRISSTDKNTILQTIPNRIAYFESKFFNMHPVAPTLSIRSQGASDGWILESTETSSVGGTMNNSATTVNLGDNAANKQYRGIITFNTGGLPDNAVITRVTLKIRNAGVTGGGNPVTTFQGFMVDIRRGVFGSSGLELGDFNASAHKTLGAFSPSPVSGWYNINISNGRTNINRIGLTQIRLRFKLDDNNNAIANYLAIHSGDAGAANRPQLIVQYYVP